VTGATEGVTVLAEVEDLEDPHPAATTTPTTKPVASLYRPFPSIPLFPTEWIDMIG
jgi:hypothetical protein